MTNSDNDQEASNVDWQVLSTLAFAVGVAGAVGGCFNSKASNNFPPAPMKILKTSSVDMTATQITGGVTTTPPAALILPPEQR